MWTSFEVHARVRALTVVLAPAALILAGCAPDNAHVASDVTKRDSAGISIVESHAPAWKNGAGWTIDTVPFLRIGTTAGDSAFMFSRIVAAARLTDGSFVVADGDSRQLRHFDSTGKLLKVAGRRGQGPGEFRSLGNIARCGRDEIWVEDDGRISIWSVNLEHRRDFKTVDMPMWPLMCFEGLSLIVKEDVRSATEVINTVYTDSLELRIANTTTGDSARRLLVVPLWEYIVITRPGGGGTGFVHPFGRRNFFASDGDGFASAGFFGNEIHSFGPDGKLRRILRAPPEDLGITADLLKRFREDSLDSRNTRYRTALETAGWPMPSGRPSFADLRIDRDRNAWVKRFAVPGRESNTWSVFAASGEMLGNVEFPRGLDLHEIGHDYLLATVRDSLGVEYIHTFRIRKGNGR